ncbi:hypothetical protein J6590_088718 [Homalodisca vitripennis]|nr:hypothetical protein J6590_088718 [Homalodisca vitripennis]
MTPNPELERRAVPGLEILSTSGTGRLEVLNLVILLHIQRARLEIFHVSADGHGHSRDSSVIGVPRSRPNMTLASSPQSNAVSTTNG